MSESPRILVLGIGNPLLHDDGVGLLVLERLRACRDNWDADIEFIDGGTQGLALLGVIADRKAVVILDAITLGAEPGTIYQLNGTEILSYITDKPISAHEGGAPEILQSLLMINEIPDIVKIVGIEPELLMTGIGISPNVEKSIPQAIVAISKTIDEIHLTLSRGELQ